MSCGRPGVYSKWIILRGAGDWEGLMGFDVEISGILSRRERERIRRSYTTWQHTLSLYPTYLPIG